MQIPAALNRFTVAPIPIEEPPEIKLSDVPENWSSPGVGCWYLGVWPILNAVAVEITRAKADTNPVWQFLPFALIAVMVLAYYLHGRVHGHEERLREFEQRKANRKLEIKKRVEESEREAETTAHSLRRMLVQARDFRMRSFHYLESASANLDRAAHDYDERAFAPFWDSIEAAAADLGAYQKMISGLSATAKRYSRVLHGRSHNFPPYPYTDRDLPSAAEVLRRLQAIVRQAQSDYEFASIWEQRKTRESVETGFGSLAAAVRGIGDAVLATLQEAHVEFARHSSTIVDAIDEKGISTVDAINQQREELKAVLESRDRKLGASNG